MGVALGNKLERRPHLHNPKQPLAFIRRVQLILIPSQQSQRRAQHVRYPTDATIVGRVTAVAMTLIEAQFE